LRLVESKNRTELTSLYGVVQNKNGELYTRDRFVKCRACKDEY